jgi:hypothetical protein
MRYLSKFLLHTYKIVVQAKVSIRYSQLPAQPLSLFIYSINLHTEQHGFPLRLKIEYRQIGQLLLFLRQIYFS